MQLFFNSRDVAFKSPFGAVRVGRAVNFSFPFRYDGTVYGVSLIVRKYTGETVNVPLYKTENFPKDEVKDFKTENFGGNGVQGEKTGKFGKVQKKAERGAEIQNYTTDLILSEEGIYFYSFEFYTGEGTRFVGRGAGGKADLNGGEWQLTVYGGYPETPHPLAGGVIYHIFADRFRKGKTERKIGTESGEIGGEEIDIEREADRGLWTESGILKKKETDVERGTDCGEFGGEKIDIEREADRGLGTESGILKKKETDGERGTESGEYKNIETEREKTETECENIEIECKNIEINGKNSTKIDENAEFCKIGGEFAARKVRNSPKIMKDWEDLPTVVDPDGVFRANDFFGGNAEGIVERLDYIADLGVNILYLSPFFEAASNHRYDTGDYFKIDPLFGDENVLKTLVDEAEKRGMIVMMDGVFNHTGSDSAYFNKHGHYDSVGAYQSEDSEYFGFYDFIKFPDKYKCWWGIEVVPTLNKANPKVKKLVRDVIYKWISFGIKGLRLDVADELPKDYLFDIRRLVKTLYPDGYLLGEVWEDASTKVSYGVLRPYLLGGQLDSVMNYPFKEAVLSFIEHNDVEKFAETVMGILENYPKYSAALLMNIIGTHDTARALNVFLETDFSGLTKTQKREILIDRKKYENKILNSGKNENAPREINTEKSACAQPAISPDGLEMNSGKNENAPSEIDAENFKKDTEVQPAINRDEAGGREINSESGVCAQPAISPDELKKAVKKLKIAALIQFTLPGIPSVYYGDEVGLLGFEDPLNRAPYPYGRENLEILEFYRTLGKFRKKYKNDLSDACGEKNDGPSIRFCSGHELLIYKIANEKVEIVVNNSKKRRNFKMENRCFDFLTGREFQKGENVEIERLEGFLLTSEL
jgi:glycosidase